MRARTIVIIFCLVLSLVPCFATSTKQQYASFLLLHHRWLTVHRSTKAQLNFKQVAVYGLVAAGVNAVVSTIIASYYADLVRYTNPKA
jgi:hypothetical protein